MTIATAVFVRDRVSAAILLVTAPVCRYCWRSSAAIAHAHRSPIGGTDVMRAYFSKRCKGCRRWPSLATLRRKGGAWLRSARLVSRDVPWACCAMRFSPALVLEFITAGAIALIA